VKIRHQRQRSRGAKSGQRCGLQSGEFLLERASVDINVTVTHRIYRWWVAGRTILLW
jgi:hypothetical protein